MPKNIHNAKCKEMSGKMGKSCEGLVYLSQSLLDELKFDLRYMCAYMCHLCINVYNICTYNIFYIHMYNFIQKLPRTLFHKHRSWNTSVHSKK